MADGLDWIDRLQKGVPNRFCKWQIYIGDREPNRVDCLSALLEGHDCICPYTQANIHRGDVNDTGNPQLYVSLCLHPYLGRCQDAEFLPEVANRLMAELPVIPKEDMWASRPPEKPTE